MSENKNDEVIFTSLDELSRYNHVLLKGFVSYLNRRQRRTHDVIHCGASLRVITDDEIINSFNEDIMEKIKNSAESTEGQCMCEIKTLSPELMTDDEYGAYLDSQCEKEWNENEAETSGPWSIQDAETQEAYRMQLSIDCADLLGKACCDCRYVDTQDGHLMCDCGHGMHNGKKVEKRNYCELWEGV